MLDITPGAIPRVVNVSEYDQNREYTVSLIDEGGVFEIPSGTTATIEGTIGGNAFSESATVSGNTITFTLSESMTAKAGDVWCKIKLTKDSKPVQTCAFILRCDRAGVEAETILHSPSFQEQINEGIAEYFDNDPPFFELPSGGQSGQALLSDGNGGAVWGEAGIPEAVKTALLACFRNVAWVNDDGQTYYDALYAALYNEPAPPSPVPNEYQRVEWVGTQNSSIAYILTGISESGMAALAGYSIHLTAAFGVSQPTDGVDTNGSVIAFSSKAGTYFGSLKTGRVAIGSSETYALPSSVVCTNKNDYIAEYSDTGLTISSNNQSVSRNYSTSGDTAQELTIGTGSISEHNIAAWSQFYSVKVYKNGTLVADFFPVYRIADGVIGFYDAVRNQFYTNSGSGSFVKGGDIA